MVTKDTIFAYMVVASEETTATASLRELSGVALFYLRITTLAYILLQSRTTR